MGERRKKPAPPGGDERPERLELSSYPAIVMSNEAIVPEIYIFLPIDQDSGLVSPSTCIGRADLEKEVALWEFNALPADLTEPQLLDLAETATNLAETNQHQFPGGRIIQCHRIHLPTDVETRLSTTTHQPSQESGSR